MRDCLRGYYLQQMGIDRWEVRTASRSQSDALRKLLIVGDIPSDDPSDKASRLFKQMLFSVGISASDATIVPMSSSESLDELFKQMALLRPKSILVLGEQVSGWLFQRRSPSSDEIHGYAHDYQGVPLVVCHPPSYLLQHPLEKKMAYQNLRILDAACQSPRD